jgi:hypothetical protein
MITLFPVIGVIGDRYSLSFAFICLAMVGSILVVANSFFMIVTMRK